ncbi:SipW-dependent-type signal peptide-containing protein [Curtobacterium sp. MCJR17_020]|uniref:SipW-dependent-type signal peptide-containing protein n=1 Tax=Curtobacterium sp. MCJR17_020 TaxID=2175619 RepID=UPI0015E8928E|nr:SipW-dependent-type signal peptide-containing protein [Curtobacterium sp. MCJR17_020]WIE74096.1 SipW-dependent-type signal peptide-containing protein [Curtobacterium sp. MCJR17_020]
MNRARWTAATIAGLLSAVLLVPQGTAAAWTDTETAAAQFTAATLPAPTFDSCGNTAGDITVTWHYATTAVPTLTAGNVQWAASGTVTHELANIITPSGTTTTGPDSTGRYRTIITAGAIGNLVSLNSFVIQAQTVLGTWTAISTNSAQGVSAGLIGIGVYTCTLN